MIQTRKIMAIISFIWILLGLFGNVVSFVVFSRPVFSKNSISTYFRALAVIDCFTIVELVMTFGRSFYDEFYAKNSDAACKMYYYITVSFAAMSGWILIAFSVDKILNMKRVCANITKKKSIQYGIVVAVVLFNLLLYIAIPIYLRVETVKFYGVTITLCQMSTLSFLAFLSFMFLIQGSLLPFIIMLTTSIISIRMIRKSTRNIESRSNTNISIRNSRDVKFAVSSVVFNISFIVL